MAVPDQRAAVLTRIREALRRPAPHRHADHSDHGTAPHATADDFLPGADAFSAWLPPVGGTREEQITLFAQNAAQLKADFRRVVSRDEAAAQIAAIARGENWQRVATHRDAAIAPVAESLALPCLHTDAGYATADLEACDGAISGCDALVAQTGSVLVSNASAGGRALSVLPPHHVGIARADQMVPDLAAALRLVRARYAPAWPSFLSFITGPSRTGDIERILVLGAHGPKKLTIFLVG